MSNWKYEKRPLEAIRKDVAAQTRLRRPFWNNLVASYLEEADFHYGRAAMIDIIRSEGLEPLGWRLDGTCPAITLAAVKDKVRELGHKVETLKAGIQEATNERQRARLSTQLRVAEQNLAGAKTTLVELEAPPAPLPAEKA